MDIRRYFYTTIFENNVWPSSLPQRSTGKDRTVINVNSMCCADRQVAACDKRGIALLNYQGIHLSSKVEACFKKSPNKLTPKNFVRRFNDVSRP